MSIGEKDSPCSRTPSYTTPSKSCDCVVHHQDYNGVNLCQEALAFTKLLINQYFVQRDLDSLPQLMDERISWIGTGRHEISRHLNEAKEALKQELSEYDGSFTVTEQELKAVPCTDDLCIVYGEILAIPEDPALSEEEARLSLVLEKTSQGMKLVHLHLSHPDLDQEQGRYYVPKAARTNTQVLRRTLALRSRQLEILNHNIPCGAHQCNNDPNFTLISMSNSFLSMFGYTSEEIGTIFHNHFIEMVYPGDRAALIAATREQLQKGNDIELEYRVMCKSGLPVWILDKGRLLEDGNGGENFYCLLIENTERKQEQEALRLSLERYQVIIDQATDIIFEWDVKKDTLHFSPNWRKKFGYDAINTQISWRIPLSKNIHPDDIPAFLKIMKDTAAGVPYSEAEFRIKSLIGQYYWCRIRATVQFDSDRHPIKAIGVIIDIDNEKKQKQALLDMAQKDALTGLYNKTTIDSLVEERMERNRKSGMQALLILDVDYFKLVNDTYGHLAGDSLLSDVATVIKGHIRSSDLAGRIGGDEFLIYLSEVMDETVTRAKVERLLAVLSLLTPERGATPISCSVGAAVFPCGGIDYYALYKCADVALYAQKNNGRKGVTFYSPAVSKRPPCGLSESAVDAIVGSDEGNVVNEQLAQYAFRMLYTARDIKATLNRLLEIIGRSYDVSRVYIFESSEDASQFLNTFEWCADGVEPLTSALQNIPYRENPGNYINNFNQNGLFYCRALSDAHPSLRPVLEARGICSMIQCSMLDEGEFVGYVGFDECRDNRSWSSQQVAGFKLTANVLSTFTVRLRQKQKLENG